MDITIEEMVGRVHDARKTLLIQVEQWFGKQDEKNKYEDWLSAIKAETVDEMVALIAEIRLFTVCSTSEINDEGLINYTFNLQANNSEFKFGQKLCQITNLFQQMFQLEKILSTSHDDPNYDEMELSRLMGENINKELVLVVKSPDAIAAYQARRRQVSAQLDKAQGGIINYIISYQNESFLANNALRDLLSIFSKTLTDAWRLEEDTRFLSSTRPLLLWHGLLMALAKNILGPEQVTRDSKAIIQIQRQSLNEISQLIEENRAKRIEEVKEKYRGLSKLAHDEIAKIDGWISVPKGSINRQNGGDVPVFSDNNEEAPPRSVGSSRYLLFAARSGLNPTPTPSTYGFSNQ